MSECVFCERIERRDYGELFHSSAGIPVVHFRPLNPVTAGHRLFVPVEHVTSALDSPIAAGAAMEVAAHYAKLLGYQDANFITSAGRHATQTVMHLHVHFIQRWEYDEIKLPWTDQQKADHG